MSNSAICNGRNREQIEAEINYLRDDNICMRNIIRSCKDAATVQEAKIRIEANREEIQRLQRDLLAVVSM